MPFAKLLDRVGIVVRHRRWQIALSNSCANGAFDLFRGHGPNSIGRTAPKGAAASRFEGIRLTSEVQRHGSSEAAAAPAALRSGHPDLPGAHVPEGDARPELKKPLAQKTLDVKVLVQICTARLSLTASPYRHDLRVAGDI